MYVPNCVPAPQARFRIRFIASDSALARERHDLAVASDSGGAELTE